MRKVKVNRVKFVNFGCIREFEADINDDITQVLGKNGVGKTHIKEGFADVFTDKTFAGTKVDDIRPHDNDGKPKNYEPIERSVSFDYTDEDGMTTSYEVKKVRSAKFHRDGTFDKNDNTCYVDGFEYKPKAFAEFMARIIGDDAVAYGMTPNPFLETIRKSTPEARAILERVSQYDVNKFIEEHPEFKEVATLMKGHSGEETKRKLKKAASDVSKAIDKKRTEIEYENRTYKPSSIDMDEQSKLIDGYVEEIKKCDAEMAAIDDASRSVDADAKKLISLKYEQASIIAKANEDAHRRQNESIRALSDRKWELKRFESEISSMETLIASEEEKKCRHEKSRENDAQLWREVKNAQFNPNDKICSYCGQPLPDEKVELLIERFNEKKQARIDSIVASGKQSQTEIKRCEAKIENYKAAIVDLKAKIDATRQDIQNLESEVNVEISDIDPLSVPEYVEIGKQISEIEIKIPVGNDLSQKKKTIWDKKNIASARCSEARMLVDNAISAKNKHESMIAQLEDELRKLAQEHANVQKQRDMIDEFSKESNKALEDHVNQYFKHFRFKMLDETADGTLYETCQIIVNGTEYFGGLNHGDRMLVDVDLVRGFQEMLQIRLPIFIDDCESLDPDRIPKIDGQLITLRRTDDPVLTIK